MDWRLEETASNAAQALWLNDFDQPLPRAETSCLPYKERLEELDFFGWAPSKSIL